MVLIDKKEYIVNETEFNILPHKDYTNLCILNKVGYYEKIIGLISELTETTEIHNFLNINSTHGGFLDICCADMFKQTFILINYGYENHLKNIVQNIKNHGKSNILLIEKDLFLHDNAKSCILFSETTASLSKGNKEFIKTFHPIMIINNNIMNNVVFIHDIYDIYDIYVLSNTNLNVFIPKIYHQEFYADFKYYIKDENVLDFDNLVNLCIMVKNGGQQFADMLKENMQYIDTWTILDTGSTDNTIDIITQTLVPFKKGSLYQEPFINFRDSRNRLIELAGNACKYLIMLDDTYVLKGNLKTFLNEVRGDQFGNSFTVYIKSDDVEYGSNRILKSICNLRYKYKIHEVIQDNDNINVVVPINICTIHDGRFEYMEKRTMDRKTLDLQLLQEEIDEDPNNPRSYYYMGQTYNLLEKYDLAFNYFMQRADHPVTGFIQEKIDAIFEGARTANYKLNKPWSECEALYLRAYELDKTRPDSIYFIGIHYFLENDMLKAYHYLKLGFEIGYPLHCQYSLKPTLSFHFLPRHLTQLCYEFADYKLGEKSAKLFLDNNNVNADYYNVIASWYNIFQHINRIPDTNTNTNVIKRFTGKFTNLNKPFLCFVADGGFDKWSGSDILVKGIGGSETYIIEMARYIQKQGHFQVFIFCNCLQEETFEQVEYLSLIDYYDFISEKHVHTCIISRFSEYYPATCLCNVENIYFVVHDLSLSGLVVPIHHKLRKIFCLTEWHVEYFNQIFPSLAAYTVPFYYGVDTNKFASLLSSLLSSSSFFTKIPHKFIYSSFPNRGLLPLLQLWPKIVEYQPNASLYIYSDVDGKWVNNLEPDKMISIRALLEEYKSLNNGLNIFYHGWVSKAELAASWLTAEYWLYPCTFMETFCLTAVEAALSKTLVITNGLAALQNTVGNRGLIVEGDPTTKVWQEETLEKLFEIMKPSSADKHNQLIQQNYDWVKDMSWENQATKLLNEFLLVDKLEYRGMYNWTNDCPSNSKEIFVSIIKQFVDKTFKSEPKILEIGTYTGTSLINIVKLIPNSKGTGIDRWKNYNEDNIDMLLNIENNEIEKTFYRNVANSGLDDRIKGIKCNSTEALLNLIRKGEQYDFIYVDGSHKCLDAYSDMILAWPLLSKNGIFVIDDYIYGVDKIQDQPLEYPFHAVNHFLEMYKDEFTLLSKGYRVFLEKI